MSSCGVAGDGPAILQLLKWNQSQFQLKLSEFQEALISPTREQLLLISYQSEALLLPLTSGKDSPSAGLENPNSLASDSREQTSSCGLSNPGHHRSSSETIHHPVICDVKSLAWGYCGDSYHLNGDSCFRELLVVSHDHDIVVHAFHHSSRSNGTPIASPESEFVHGKWVEWGHTDNKQAQEQFGSHFPSSESSYFTNGIDGTKERPDAVGKGGDDEPPGNSFTPKRLLRTFLTKVETSESEGCFLTRFPAKSSFPYSAEVVSFSIGETVLEFLCHTNNLSGKKSQSSETVPISSVDLPNCEESIPTSLHTNCGSPYEVCNQYVASSVMKLFKCPKVFSSSSHRFIGLLLKYSDDLPIDASGENLTHPSKTSVIVVMVHEWGLQCVCSVDLQCSCPGPNSEAEWVDFQFSDDFLICLNTSGLICIWSAKTGNVVSHLNVRQSCELNLKLQPELDQSKLPVKKELSSRKGNLYPEVQQGDEVHGRESDAEGCVSPKISFKRLVVASYSLLLAAIDEHGVIYVVCADKYVTGKHAFERFSAPSRHSAHGILCGWKAAGSDIGGQKIYSDLFSGQGLNDSFESKSSSNKDRIEDEKHVKKEKQFFLAKESQILSSGDFTTAIQTEGRQVPRSEISFTPMRRVLIPMDRFTKDDFILFSPLGIIRLVTCCNSKEKTKIVHTCLHVTSPVLDERDMNNDLQCRRFSSFVRESAFSGEAVGCCFQGSLYLVTQDGLSVVLPSVSVSSGVLPVEYARHWRPSTFPVTGYGIENLLVKNEPKDLLWIPWQIEILDRVLLYENPEEADRICLENGWDLKIARMRRMQLALHYLKPDEIERSLEMLADVNLAEEGILRLLFTTVYQIFCKVGSDSEVAMATRFLALAACFATKMVRRYELLKHEKHRFIFESYKGLKTSSLQPKSPSTTSAEKSNSGRLCEMAYFLEVIRNLQCRLFVKCRRPGQGVVDGKDAPGQLDTTVPLDDPHLAIPSMDLSSGVLDALVIRNSGELDFIAPDPAFDSTRKLELLSMESSIDADNTSEFYAHVAGVQRRKTIPWENPRDMITRWEIDNMDLKTVVQDALHSGRLPLAVLQLHLHRLRELVSEEEPQDTFNEIRDIGRAIAYDLFLKGENGLAIATLQRLGDDIEVNLRQLVFGTVRRSIRTQIAEDMKRLGYLKPHEWKTLENIYLIERLYPSCSFWGTYLGKKKKISDDASSFTFQEENQRGMSLHVWDNFTIECGEIDGVVIGSWKNVLKDPSLPVVDEDGIHNGYWACAAVWSDAWDQRTMDRVMLDQPSLMGIHVPWESKFEYHVVHNDWEEVYKLLDMIPSSLLSEETLKINLDRSHSSSNIGSHDKFSDDAKYIFSNEELDPVYINIPNVKIFRFSVANICSSWLKNLMEQELAKKFIFLKEFWESTAEVMPLLARAGLIIISSELPIEAESLQTPSNLHLLDIREKVDQDTAEAMHKLVIHYCVQYNLPNLLDLYLDHHKLVLDNDSLCSLQEAAGGCQWAKWLLFSRIKGCEYEASFSNAWSILSPHMILGGNLSVLEVDEIIHTVDDIAEGGGEMSALATLMYAPLPIQKCLCSGSVSRHGSSSSQCTLENLRPGLQHFPTLWRTLVSACFGQDTNVVSSSPNANNVFGKSAFADYLNWRDNIFSSSGGDTSLVQMLPCWFPKPIRRLIKLFVQGPLGWQSQSGAVPTAESFLHRDNAFVVNANKNTVLSAISWEEAIQNSIEEELYSSFEENGFGVEQNLHRGRPFAAFNHLLSVRALKLKSTHAHQEPSGGSSLGQTNIQSDVQTLLGPLTMDEGSLLSSVVPLAIMHFEDSVLVTSCAFLLELCGLSTSMLHVDIAALHRISSYYKSIGFNSHYEHVSPKGSAFHAVSGEADFTLSLAQALADDYMRHDNVNISELKEAPLRAEASKQPSQALMTVLQHLEKASLPLMEEGMTCGSWLLSGMGDGAEFRSQQKAASQNWNLVTAFCQMHHLPLSTKYLALLAKDNDWVGFLTEAQVTGFHIDTIIQVAAKEFSDPRLKIHILTVLRSLYSTRRKASSSTNSMLTGKNNESSFLTESETVSPVELFGLVAECEKQKKPGRALLIKAKDLRWSLLAMIASCFPDVSPLSCLTVWLEITAARETSSIKVNDIASQIASNVGAAVEANNALPNNSRALTFRYNRRNPKRRRQIEPTSGFSTVCVPFNVPDSPRFTGISVSQDSTTEAERRKEADEETKNISDPDEGLVSLSNMVAVLCEQHLFLPLLRAFEMFLPSCSLLPFIRSLQAFSQMRLSEASAHLASFSARIKEEPYHMNIIITGDAQVRATWISSTAVKAAEAMLSTCPSAYERRCLLQLLAAVDFGDGGSASTCFKRLYWKINLAEPSLRRDDGLRLGNETLDDSSLLETLEKCGHWEQARNWEKQLESSGGPWKPSVHHVTEMQAEAMVAEWKEYLWDVPEERAALWSYCQKLFLKYSFPALQAGIFFLKHAEAIEKDIAARELHELLLLALQWLSGTITQLYPVYPLHLLREIETRVWLLAVESEAQSKSEQDFSLPSSLHNTLGGNGMSIIEQTASIVTKMDNHINAQKIRASERNGARESIQTPSRHIIASDGNNASIAGSSTRTKRRTKTYLPSRRSVADTSDRNNDSDDFSSSPYISRSNFVHDDNTKIETSFSGWEERVRPAEVERAVLSLLEFGQISAARQLQQKLSPENVPFELVIVDTALKLATISSSFSSEISTTMLDQEILSVIQSYNILSGNQITDSLQVLESLATKCSEGCGRGLCKRIIAVVKAAKVLGLPFSEAFEKHPIELLQLLSLKAQDSLEEARLLVQTHIMPPASVARILAESFLKGLLAAHRGGYMDSQKEEGPAPLLWRFSDFLKWAELCPSEPEIGHALMRLVITGQEIPHACEVELLILSHHFYKSSACLDGVDVLVTLAANRVESYVSEGDFTCLARLVTGVNNFHALNFILGILIENGQLELLLQKYSAADTATGTAESVRGFRMAVLTSLKHFNPHDLDAFAMVYNHFDMKHETASLLESRSMHSMHQWLLRHDKDRQNEDLLEAMHYLIEAAGVHSTIDAGQKTHRACARASLLSLQIRIPDLHWLELTETNARRALVEQSRFQEALIVAEAYCLNQPSEWALVLWNQMLRPDLIEQFVAEFVLVLPLQPSMLLELARFYRAEVAARGDQSHFSVWLSPGGLPAEWVKHLGKSFRYLLKRTRDLRVRVQLATIATGFGDVIDLCVKLLDKVPDNAGPLILRKGHGGTYLPLM